MFIYFVVLDVDDIFFFEMSLFNHFMMFRRSRKSSNDRFTVFRVSVEVRRTKMAAS